MIRKATNTNGLFRAVISAVLSLFLVITAQVSVFAETPGAEPIGSITRSVVQMAIKDGYTLAVLSDGTLWGWGCISSLVSTPQTGGLMTSLTNLIEEPVQLGSDFKSVAVSKQNAAAIKNDGSLWLWGANFYHELGYDTGENTYSLYPGKVEGISNVSRVYLEDAAGYGGPIIAITENGDLYAWGVEETNSILGYQKGLTYGQYISDPTLLFSGVAQASAFGESIAVIDKAGKLWTWGDNFNGVCGVGNTVEQDSPVQPARLENKTFKYVKIINWTCVALTDNGELWTWGKNYDGSTNTLPVQMNLPEITGIGGGQTLFAIDKNGDVWALGNNNCGQCGQGTFDRYGNGYTSLVKVTGQGGMPAKANSFINVPNDTDAVCPIVLMSDGDVWGWGANSGKLGADTGPEDAPNFTLTPVKVFSDVVGGWASVYPAYLVRSDGTLWGAGSYSGAASGNSYPVINGYRRVYFGDKPAEGSSEGTDDNKPGYGNTGGSSSDTSVETAKESNEGMNENKPAYGDAGGPVSPIAVGTAESTAFEFGTNAYKVTGKNTVSFIKSTKQSGSVTIPAVISKDGVKYKVTSIADNAFKNKRITKVIIGTNVTSIGKKAFYNCKKLRTIVVRTTKLKKARVGAKAFQGVYKKVKVKVPVKEKASYRKWLLKRGLSKSAKVTKL